MVSPDLLAQLREAIGQQLGWNFETERASDLLRGVNAAAQEAGKPSVEAFVRELLRGPLSASQVQQLSKHLTIGETYFWREPQSLNLFRSQILPQLLQKPRSSTQPLRIWSAGCSTGEEAYSLAILLCETLSPSERDHISILATDINPVALQKAQRGVYGQWSFRGAPEWLKSRYLRPHSNGHFQIAPEVQQMVSFSELNLANSTYPTPWGNPESIATIWCRNVLIYFGDAQTSQVLARFYQSLEVGGFLVVAPCEIARTGLSPFKRVSFPEMTFFQKGPSPQTPASKPTPTFSRAAPTSITQIHPAVPMTRAQTPSSFVPTTARVTSPFTAAPKPASISTISTVVSQSSVTTAVSSSPTANVETVMETIRVAANSGQLEKALELAQQAQGIHKLEPGLHYLTANILQELGRLDEASIALRRSIFLDTDFILGHFALANLARRRGNTQEAERHLNTTLSLLRRFTSDTVLPESDGLTAGQLIALISNRQKSDSA